MIKSNVSVSRRNMPASISPQTIRRRLERILRYLELPKAKISCVLCDDAFIKDLNKIYRNKNKPTDVLSFAMNEGEVLIGDENVLGDIVISVETAIKQGEKLGHTPLEEVTSLAIHGILHLLGYDHTTKTDERIMWEKAKEIEELF